MATKPGVFHDALMTAHRSGVAVRLSCNLFAADLKQVWYCWASTANGEHTHEAHAETPGKAVYLATVRVYMDRDGVPRGGTDAPK